MPGSPLAMPGSPLAKDYGNGSRKHPLLELQNSLTSNPSSLKLENSNSVDTDENSGKDSFTFRYLTEHKLTKIE